MKTRASSLHLTARVLGVLALAAVTFPAATASAQGTQGSIEFRPFVGAMVPTGDQKDIVKNSVLVGAELGWQFLPHFAVTGAFGYSPVSQDVNNHLNIYQYDLALEGRMNSVGSISSLTFRPYGRLGAGARTYRYQGLTADNTQNDFLAHGAIGVDIAPATSSLGLRIEARDNVVQFKGLAGELANSVTRNDLQFTAGFTFHM